MQDEVSYSSTTIDSTNLNAVPNETNKAVDKLEVDSTTKDNTDVQNETSLQTANNISESSIIDCQKSEVKKSGPINEGSLESNTSDSTSDTHGSEPPSAKNCNNSIVQKGVDNSEREQLSKENDIIEKEDDVKINNATSEQDSKGESAPLNIVRVSSDGDGKTHVAVPSLIRSNECLEDYDDGPASKRQRLCAIEDNKNEELQDKDLSETSEAKLQ